MKAQREVRDENEEQIESEKRVKRKEQSLQRSLGLTYTFPASNPEENEFVHPGER